MNSFSNWLMAIVVVALCGCATKDPDLVYPYDEPLTSPGVKLAGLPPAARRAVRAQVGSEEIHDVVRFTHGGEVVYQIVFRHSRLFPPLYLRSDGSVLTPDMQVAVAAEADTFGAIAEDSSGSLSLSDLPVQVANRILETAPTAEIARITTVAVEDAYYYEVEFKDAARHPNLLFAEDGSLVETVPPSREREVPVRPRYRDSAVGP